MKANSKTMKAFRPWWKLTQFPQKCLFKVFPDFVCESAYCFNTFSPLMIFNSPGEKRWLCPNALPLPLWQFGQWQSTEPASYKYTFEYVWKKGRSAITFHLEDGPLSTPVTEIWTCWQLQIEVLVTCGFDVSDIILLKRQDWGSKDHLIYDTAILVVARWGWNWNE